MSKWSRIYLNEIKRVGGPEKFIKFKAKEKTELISIIKKFTPRYGNILEAGCGTGANSCFLSSLGYSVVALDNDKFMLSIAKKLGFRVPNKPTFMMGDLMTISFSKKFDVVFSHGVLEHFKNNEIIKIINKQLQIGKIVIFSVPSDYFSESQKMYGDERFMNLNQWEKIIDRTRGLILKRFGYYFQNYIYRAVNKFLPNLLIHKAPYIGFVLRPKNKKDISRV